MRTRFELARTLGFVSALAVPAMAHAYQLDYHVEVGVEHNDNVELTGNDPVDANILEPKLGFNLAEQGSTIQANATGVLEYYDYLGGELADQFRSTLSARVNWTMVPERLNFTFEDFLGLEPIDALKPTAQNNLQQTNVFGLGPSLDFRLGETMRAQAELRYVTSHAQDTPEFNSNRLAAAVRAIKDLDSVTAVSANLADEFIDFQDTGIGQADYSRYSAFGRYRRKWSRFDLTSDLGWGWINYKTSRLEDHNAPLARVTAAWHATDRSTFSLDGAYQYSDTATDMLSDISFSGGIPGSIATGAAVGTSQAYLERSLSFGYIYGGDRGTFSVRPYYRQLDYLTLLASINLVGANQTARGVSSSFSWVLRPLLTATIGGSYDKTRYDTISSEDEVWDATAQLSQQWTRNWSGQISYTYYDRKSEVPGSSAVQNIIYVAVTYSR